MRILYLLTQDLESPSGLGRYLPLASEMAKIGHQVTIAALHSNFESLVQTRYESGGVEISYLGPMHVRKQGNIKTYYSSSQLLQLTTRATIKFARLAVSSQADIIHICKPHPMNSLGGLAGKYLTGKHVFLDCDDYEAAIGHFKAGWQQKVVQFFENWTPHRVDGITTHTDFNRQRLLSNGVPPDKIFYVSNGVDRERFKPPDQGVVDGLRLRLGLQNRQIILYVGSLSSPSHPVDLLFQAFAHVHQAVPETVLLLVGGGDEFTRLQAIAAQMGLAGAITFTGRVSPAEVVNYYHLAQVSVDPVYDDGAALGRSPLKLFESWACGVPFVTADVGERRRLLGDPPAGLLCSPGDVESLAHSLEQVLTDDALKDELRHRGSERIQNYYWDVLVKDMEAAYLAISIGR